MLDLAVMKKNGAGLVLLFGSQATRRRHPLSDTDIGVVFNDDKKRLAHPVEVYSQLADEVKKHFRGKIDIVYLEETPLSLQYRAVMDGKILYASEPAAAADYKEKVLKKYFDFKFIEDIFHSALLAR